MKTTDPATKEDVYRLAQMIARLALGGRGTMLRFDNAKEGKEWEDSSRDLMKQVTDDAIAMMKEIGAGDEQ